MEEKTLSFDAVVELMKDTIYVLAELDEEETDDTFFVYTRDEYEEAFDELIPDDVTADGITKQDIRLYLTSQSGVTSNDLYFSDKNNQTIEHTDFELVLNDTNGTPYKMVLLQAIQLK
jgi:hypothetical protein